MTQDELKAAFIYEPETGRLRRRVLHKSMRQYPGRAIGKGGAYMACDLLSGCVRKTFYHHQLVWLYHHGYIPPKIDHRDRDTRNNRIENLRECTDAQNQYNSKRKSNNRSGFKGVVPTTKGYVKPWKAKITISGKVLTLGYFDDPAQAHAAYVEAAKRHAGEFAHVG